MSIKQEARRAQWRERYKRNREKKLGYVHNHYIRNRERILSARRGRPRSEAEKQRAHKTNQAWGQRLRLEILQHYSPGALQCANCGEPYIPALTLDHINDDGPEDRAKYGTSSGTRFWRLLKREGFPPRFQVLCWICNSLKRFPNAKALLQEYKEQRAKQRGQS